ncbi:hypothetical protein BB561_007031, partial [Smittium simulii]
KILPGERLDLIDPTFEGPQPVHIQLGDFDNDGFPDLLLTTITKAKNKRSIKRRSAKFFEFWDSLFGAKKQIEVDSNSKIRLLRNVPLLVDNKPVKGKRTFELIKDEQIIKGLREINSPTRAIFFDMDENGTLDILVSYLDNKKKPKLMVMQNSFDTASSFFIKPSLCPEFGDSENKNDLSYMYGGSFTCILSSGTKSLVMTGVQYPQQSYRSIQQPYSFFGLGEFNNYVDKIYIGSTQGKVYSFESLIPNSRLFFRVDLTQKLKPILLLPNAKNSHTIILGLVVTVFCLVGIIFFLNKLEKEADLREKQKQLFWINFDAL